ncbi:hypothetical protein C8E89_120113 [Mycolicibacterium moriokaense]|uniref:Uncharacterized protein n=1 Tax=Mycolicibacterium moriokaense TaxID=39691 RepID=A0A318HB08_9MYCO|nr:hypothetical protein C8E89_120113 [Mycolicibacterium moriokaense]
MVRTLASRTKVNSAEVVDFRFTVQRIRLSEDVVDFRFNV